MNGKNLAELMISHEEATNKLQDRIQKGKDLCNKNLSNEEDFEKLKADHEKWEKFNTELLSRIFSNSSIADEYSDTVGGAYLMDQGWTYWAKEEKIEIERGITRLEAIQEKLELIPSKIKAKAEVVKNISNNIFVVHGHDESAKQITARFLQQLKLNPIILHEKANEGRTIIEKFEHHSDTDFAVVLLTPDDIGYSKQDPDNKSDRARQNVILELGYFIGKLGRKNVCALLKNGVEVPSDFQGVIYIPFDDHEAWKLKLALEIKIAGIKIDLNDLS